MSEQDSAALFARVERAQRYSDQAIGMIGAQAERIGALEKRLAEIEKLALEKPPAYDADETAQPETPTPQ